MSEGVKEKEGATHPLLEWGNRLVSDLELHVQVRKLKDRILSEMPEEGLPVERPSQEYECPSIDVLGRFVLLFREEEQMGGGTDGWVALPYDSIPSGTVGYHFFRSVGPPDADNATEKSFSVAYHIHGKLAVEEVLETDPKNLWDLLCAPDTYSADDPLKQRVGFVRYYPEESRSVWTTMTLSQILRSRSELPAGMEIAIQTYAGRARGKDPFTVEKERLRQLLGD